MRKARTTRSRTQLPHLEPPYARWTVFLGFEIWAYSWGRRAGTCREKAPSQHAIFQQLPLPCDMCVWVEQERVRMKGEAIRRLFANRVGVYRISLLV